MESAPLYALERRPWVTATSAIVCGWLASFSGYLLLLNAANSVHFGSILMVLGFANLILGGICMVFSVLSLRRRRDGVVGLFFSVLAIALLNALFPRMGDAGYYFCLLTLLLSANLAYQLRPSV